MGLGKVNNKTQKWNENNNLNFIVGKYDCRTSKFKERERERSNDRVYCTISWQA